MVRFPLLFLIFCPIFSTGHWCYSCYGEDANSTCFRNARGAGWVDCEKGECQVWTLYPTTSPSNVYMFERSCNEICQPGCVEISDMGHRFTSCSTCCSTNFCNIGSDGTTRRFHSILLLISFFLIFSTTRIN